MKTAEDIIECEMLCYSEKTKKERSEVGLGECCIQIWVSFLEVTEQDMEKELPTASWMLHFKMGNHGK